MPKLGLTMSEGMLAEWRVQPGQPFRKGDVVFVVETEKVANEVAADCDGTIEAVLVPEGGTASVGVEVARLQGSPEPQLVAPADPEPRHNWRGPARRIIVTPLARRLARQAGIDLGRIKGSGPRGRIKAIDLDRSKIPEVRPAAPTALANRMTGPEDVQSALVQPSANQTVIAERLAAANAVPHFALVTTAIIDDLLALRGQVTAAKTWPKTTLTAYVAAAFGRALADHPDLALLWRPEGLLRCGTGDVGVAVDTPRGLFVPRLRDTTTRSIGALAADLARLADASRTGTLTRRDLEGGVASVSNLGAQRVLYNHPMIDPQQSFMLGVGRVDPVFRPDVEGRPILRSEIGLVLVADHRVANGVAAAALLASLVDYLETPMRLFMPPL